MRRKINIELPKYRLQMHVKVIKRRKPLLQLDEPIIIRPSKIDKRYRTGTLPGKLVRYFTGHKNIRKIFASAFATFVAAMILVPHPQNIQAEASENVILEAETNLATEKSMIYPVGKVVINQGYSIFHKALDFGGTLDTPIKPVMNGVVAYAGWDRSGYGNLIVLLHRNGIESYYAHLSKIYVKTGDIVTTDTIIGKMGATGRATGIHLHLEIHQNGLSLNPLTVLSK